jgi:hypothetical protein
MTLIERILCKLFNYTEIKNDDDEAVYLRRWFLYPRVPENDKQSRRLYLHKFFRSDKDRDLHDHPWNFRSLILTAGYWEHSYNPAWLRWKHGRIRAISPGSGQTLPPGFKHLPGTRGAGYYVTNSVTQEPPKTVRKWYGPFSYLKRGDKWAHRVELDNDKPVWTLFLTDVKSRQWGFHTDKGWCYWKNYFKNLCWCED